MATRSSVDRNDAQHDTGLLSRINWYAVHTRSRHEKHVHRQLVAASIESFLPLREERRRWKDRWKWVEFPMFPGYLFVHATGAHLETVWRARGVAQVLGAGWEHPTPVPEEQIARVQALIHSGVPVEPYPYLEKGTRIRVLRGPLMGIEGLFVKHRNLDRIVISVDLIGKAVCTEINSWDVEPV